MLFSTPLQIIGNCTFCTHIGKNFEQTRKNSYSRQNANLAFQVHLLLISSVSLFIIAFKYPVFNEGSPFPSSQTLLRFKMRILIFLATDR